LNPSAAGWRFKPDDSLLGLVLTQARRWRLAGIG